MSASLMTPKHQSQARSDQPGRPWPVRADGWLRVEAGPLWLTRLGDPDDHVLMPGERLALRRGDRIVTGAWLPDRPIAWRYDSVRAGRAAFLATFLATFLAALADAFEAVAARARSAAASASRAQGCICIGDSMASSGTLK
ncbi:MAG: hypothetical protein RLZZ524_46 [Pseudomonadota bacterium]